MRKIAVIYNAKSGTAMKANELESLFKNVQLEPDLIKLSPSLPKDMQKAHKSGIKVFVAVGGDGTVNAVASEVLHLHATLGVLPLGTLNHFAKDLHLPTDPEKAARIIARGHTKKIDTACVNNHLFLNNSSIGVYPLLVREREKKEGVISKWPAAFLALFRTLHKKQEYDITLDVDNEKKQVKTPFIFIGNNPYNLNEPGVMSRKSLTNGVLETSVVKTNSTAGLFRIALDIAIGKPHLSGNFTTYTTKKLTLKLPQSHTDVAFDGETKQLKTPLHYSIKPKSLNVIVRE